MNEDIISDAQSILADAVLLCTNPGHNSDHQAQDSTITLTSPDPYRDPIVSCKARRRGASINIYRFSNCVVPDVYKPLFKASQKILIKNIEKAFGSESGNISYELLMCGPSPEASQPALVVRCGMNLVPKVQNLFTRKLSKSCHLHHGGTTARWVRRFKQSIGASKNDECLSLGLEIFGCGTQTRPPVRTLMRSENLDSNCLELHTNLRHGLSSLIYGARIRSLISNSSATLCGLLRIGSQLLGLTTSHAFRKDCDGNDHLCNSYQLWNMDGCTVSVEISLNGHQKQAIKAQVWLPSAKYFASQTPDLDWALVMIDQDLLAQYESSLDDPNKEESLVSSPALKQPKIEPEVLILSPGSEYKQGLLLHGTVFNTECSKPEVPVWTLEMARDRPVLKGDSGSLVIDANDGTIYGYIVAVDAFDRAEIIPLHSALHQISVLSGMNKVEFLDPTRSYREKHDISARVRTVAEHGSMLQPSTGTIIDNAIDHETLEEPPKSNPEAESGEQHAQEAYPDLKQLKSCNEYCVGWIAALSIELASAKAMLDEQHQAPADYVRCNTDLNTYTWGRVGTLNTVIIGHPGRVSGSSTGAMAAMQMLASFPNIKFGLLVGIGSGVPTHRDIRLGDVVVSQPTGASGGVFQYDFGKYALQNRWETTGSLSRPPEVLLRALANLRSDHMLQDAKPDYHLHQAASMHKKWGEKFGFPDPAHDILFQSSYQHSASKNDCSDCDQQQVVARPQRTSTEAMIHYGVIGSSNAVIKDGSIRDKLASLKPECICLEMEAAGLMDNFPCLVIRGISDYADSHKNDHWSRYASATAAAFAKELLPYIPSTEVQSMANAASWVKNAIELPAKIKMRQEQGRLEKEERNRKNVLGSLAEASKSYIVAKNSHPKRIDGTCGWFTKHESFKSWQEQKGSGLLWVTANPGCGKSVLAKHLVDDVLPLTNPSAAICYFFFDNKSACHSASQALCAILLQVALQRLSTSKDEIFEDLNSPGSGFTQSIPILWSNLLSMTSTLAGGEVVCVLDALDECEEEGMWELIRRLNQFGLQSGSSSKLKFIITSRPDRDISTAFQEVEQKFPMAHLKGDGDDEATKISHDIDLVISLRIQQICKIKSIHLADEKVLYARLTRAPHQNYIWSQAILDGLEKSSRLGIDPIQSILNHLSA